MSCIKRTRDELAELLAVDVPAANLIPDACGAALHPEALRQRPAVGHIEAATAEPLAAARDIPQLTYTLYRDVQRHRDRNIYHRPRQEKYARQAAVAFQVLLGNEEYVDLLHDYMWSACEETAWILPNREDLRIDLRTAATAFDLAEMVVALEHRLEDRLIARVREEIDRRVFADYLANHGARELNWWKHVNNWNGVCNGGIGSAFLLLERDAERLARALEVVLEGLQAYLDTAFEADGASGEGMGYWQYGLSNYICFSEMLRIRTGGALDLLDNERMRQIARYPLAVMLSPGRFFPYSDCNEHTGLMPGLTTRLAERTGVSQLLGLLAEPATLSRGAGLFHTAWRDALWWDGVRPAAPALPDAQLPVSQVVRLTSRTPSGVPLVLAAKAGHNGVPHNHNDVGTFVLHVDGETCLVDPERGSYDNYVVQGHANVIFANSFGHSVPVIGGALQSAGAQFAGQIARYASEGEEKVVEMELAGAYQVAALRSARRSFRLSPAELVLEDVFTFAGGGLPLEEAFVTWSQAWVRGATAYIAGATHLVELRVEAPAGAAFDLAVLAEESAQNNKPMPLKRLSLTVAAAGGRATVRVRIRVLA